MKPEGLAAVAQALRYWEQRQDVVSNNLANVDTPGFKGERVFAQVLQGAVVGTGEATDFTPGALTTTGNPLDLALTGDGFFVVQTPAGERLTRGGSFSLDASGTLTDAAGHPVLTDRGPVVIPPGKVEIDSSGAISVDGQPLSVAGPSGQEVARLRVETVPRGTQLTHDGGTLFVPAATCQEMPPDARTVKQGALEQSNVSTVGSLVDLITIQRSYAAAQSTAKVLDGVMSTISNDLSRVS